MSRSVLALLLWPSLVSVPAAQGVGDRNERDALQHYRAGEEAMHGERLDVAEREFREAVKLDPLLHLAHYGLGQVFDEDEAISARSPRLSRCSRGISHRCGPGAPG